MSNQLHDWFINASPDQRENVAKKAETTVAYLIQLAGGHRKPSPDLARRLSIATEGKLTREGLRPDIYGELSAA